MNQRGQAVLEMIAGLGLGILMAFSMLTIFIHFAISFLAHREVYETNVCIANEQSIDNCQHVTRRKLEGAFSLFDQIQLTTQKSDQRVRTVLKWKTKPFQKNFQREHTLDLPLELKMKR
ncbi:MAG: hypothetical protein AB7H97_16140, partial [Pseudobdellovibrionaceae bacterium]